MFSYPVLHYPIQPSIYAFVCPLVHPSLIRPFVHPFSHLFFHSFSVRRCSSLAAPQFGFIYPYRCTSFPASGTVCHLECGNGFIGNGGVNEMRCGKNGKWSSNKSLIFQCLGTVFCYSFFQPRCSVSHAWCERVFANIYRIVCRFLTYKKS